MADNNDEEEFLTDLDRLIAEDEEALRDLENDEDDEEETEEDRELSEQAKEMGYEIRGRSLSKQRRQRKIQERLLQNKLKLIFSRSLNKTRLTEAEKKVINQAKNFPKLKNEIKKIELLLLSNKTKNFYKMISASPVLFYILIGAMLLFLVIAVISVVGSIFSWLFPSEDSDGTANSIFGITGADFYGARMVYADDEKASKEIVENYVDFIKDVNGKAENVESVKIDSTTYSVNLNITLNIPEDYDYLNYNESDFSGDYSEVYNLAFDIAKATYLADNGQAYSSSRPSLIECANGIKYFGIGDFENVSAYVIKEIVTIESITATTTDEGGETVEVTEDSDKQAIETAIENQLIADYATSNYSLRAEKLFVKDYILEQGNEESRISGITKENYVAMIFMPNKNVNFTNFTFAVGGIDLNNFSVSLNGDQLSTDQQNLGSETSTSYIFGTGKINLNASKFTYIDSTNVSALSNGLSLFEIINNSDLNYSLYLDTTTEVLTIKKNGVVFNMVNDQPYNFVEWETTWSASN